MPICKRDFAQIKIFFSYSVIQMEISPCYMVNYGEKITMPAINSLMFCSQNLKKKKSSHSENRKGSKF